MTKPGLRSATMAAIAAVLFMMPVAGAGGAQQTAATDDARIRDLNARADKGDVDAQWTLASLYNSTLRKGGEQAPAPDDRIALQWYLAIANHKPTPVALGLGENPPPEQIPIQISAIGWVGKFYEDGLGTDRNLSKAFQWMRLDAELGYDPAVIEVARMYAQGLGTPQDAKTARDWLETLPDNTTAQLDLAELYMFEGRNLTDAGTKAFNILTALARNEQIDALHRRGVSYDLGQLYLNGIGTAKDYKKAAEFLGAAARAGEPHAQYLMAYLSRQGLGVLQDNEQAYAWATLAAANGDAQAVALRDSIRTSLSQPELDKARAQAADWAAKDTPH